MTQHSCSDSRAALRIRGTTSNRTGTRTAQRSLLWAAVLGIWVSILAGQNPYAGDAREKTGRPRPPVDSLFSGGQVPELRITISAKGMASLRQAPRKAVKATVTDGDVVQEGFRIHLKGSSGSFRGIDDKPSLTLKAPNSSNSLGFRGIQTIHLNNSVEDPTYLCEWLGTRLAFGAGLPTPRTDHAIVHLNGRRLGLYVLKESFGDEFLRREFGTTGGNLYDTNPGCDIDGPLHRDRGAGPDAREALNDLWKTSQLSDLAQRWTGLVARLDTDAFISFAALEVLLCHRDGYCLARNNFRIYQNPETQRYVFLLHGMDNLFGRPDLPAHPSMQGIMAKSILETPEGRQRFDERLQALCGEIDVAAMEAGAQGILARLKPVVTVEEFKAVNKGAAELVRRVQGRLAFLAGLSNQSHVGALRFDHESILLTNWWKHDPGNVANFEATLTAAGIPRLRLWLESPGSVSWRNVVRLPAGRYRLECEIRTRSLEGLGYGRNRGAGLRVVGREEIPYDFVGDHDWTTRTIEFELETERDAEFACEARARRGEVSFENPRLKRLPRENSTPSGQKK